MKCQMLIKLMETLPSLTEQEVLFILSIYTIVDGSNNVLLSVDNNNALQDCAIKQHVTNQLSPISTVVTTHTSALSDHETRLLSIQNIFDPTNVFNGSSSSNIPFQVGTIAISNNTIGYIRGDVKSKSSFINFQVYCKNQAGTVSILSFNKDCYYLGGSEDISFSVNSTNIVLTLTNTNSSTNYRVLYNTDFIAL